MARPVPPTDVLITLMGSPHAGDLTTSALRLTQALLARGASVQVWACGYATLLTQQALGETKPRDVANWGTRHPSTATLVRGLIETFPGRLFWYGCRFCSEDRGATNHIPEVPVRPPFVFADHVAAAGKTMYLGVM